VAGSDAQASALPQPLIPQYKVKDINEADFGRLEIDLAGAFFLGGGRQGVGGCMLCVAAGCSWGGVSKAG